MPPNMVMVSGGEFGVGVAKPVVLPDFWLDKYEVTNREFKRFMDADGYRDRKFWTEPFLAGDRVLGFDEAIARFRDLTGRPGPASWELGSYPAGQDDFPVAGISWFEAAAFAVFSGKSLPTVYHWYRAANIDELSSDILRLSNFEGKGLRRVGESGGLGPWGTLDMAGNVKEWCTNLTEGTTLRYVLGGSWDEPSYRYMEPDAQDPWGRSTRFGVRLVKDAGAIGDAAAPIRACLRRSQDRRARIRCAGRSVSPLLPVRPHPAERACRGCRRELAVLAEGNRQLRRRVRERARSRQFVHPAKRNATLSGRGRVSRARTR